MASDFCRDWHTWLCRLCLTSLEAKIPMLSCRDGGFTSQGAAGCISARKNPRWPWWSQKQNRASCPLPALVKLRTLWSAKDLTVAYQLLKVDQRYAKRPLTRQFCAANEAADKQVNQPAGLCGSLTGPVAISLGAHGISPRQSSKIAPHALEADGSRGRKNKPIVSTTNHASDKSTRTSSHHHRRLQFSSRRNSRSRELEVWRTEQDKDEQSGNDYCSRRFAPAASRTTS